jgi:acyl-CoA synthetase (NDP forming)
VANTRLNRNLYFQDLTNRCGGFAETGSAGAALQAQVAERARAHKLRLMGPNSLGFINFTERVHAWTTPVRAPSRAAGVAIISQSGATAYFLAELAWQQDLGLSIVAATGNEADLDAAAFLDHLVDDRHTRAIALFIETVRHPARFLAAAMSWAMLLWTCSTMEGV